MYDNLINLVKQTASYMARKAVQTPSSPAHAARTVVLGEPPAASAPPAGARPTTLILERVQPVRNLADEVVQRISTEIECGRLLPGARLPTEMELMAALGVSRTVVREAVSALRARGLVTTRQGAGAFVADAPSRPYVIETDGVGSLQTVREILQLRLAVEVETAALAAATASNAARRSIRMAHTAFERAIVAAQPAVREDFAFHLAIARATGNKLFAEFLEFLGRHFIPRQSIRAANQSEAEERQYLERILREHEAIVIAIEKRQSVRARDAMRRHLANSAARYAKMEASAR